ncbi:MAG: hypothetical protein KGK11_02400 [Sphingomonadales bacterium]|nr:hypothetical protein [Sphingomonadales bacterium]
MARLTDRIARLEVSRPHPQRTAIDAAAFNERIKQMCDRFADADARVTESERATWSPASRLAWALRFGSDEQVKAAIDQAKRLASEAART